MLLTIEFDSQVYINKKALEYITQEYNQEKGKKGNLKTISERIIYLAQHQNDFRDVVSEILSEITNFFELDKSIDINNPRNKLQKVFLSELQIIVIWLYLINQTRHWSMITKKY